MATYAERQSTGSAAWGAVTSFAATMMILAGSLNAINGLIAIFNDEWVVFGNQADLYLDITEWGWVHLVLGLAVIGAGIAVLTGNVLARTVGVVLAGLSIVANFLWLPTYPVWCVIVITMDVLVIWALTVHGRDVRD
jgi:hypothetical protein